MTVSQLATLDRAREITQAIRDHLKVSWRLIAEAYETRVWEALEYPTWDAYLAGEFGAAPLRVPREQRSEIVGSLRAHGLSTRAIAGAMGVSRETVRRDVLPTDTDVAVDRVQSLDGRSRPATQPPRAEPQPAPPRAEHHDDADLYRQLDDRLADTAARFRTNFTSAIARADDVWQFDADRVAEVIDHDDLRVYVSSWRRWCDDIDRRLNPGLRVIGGRA